MRSAPAAAILMAAPAAAHAAYWEPGIGAAPETHHYTICDTVRQFCYNADLEFLAPVLHEYAPYWVVRADMTVLAGFPPGMEYPRGFVADPWCIIGEPRRDMELLDDLPPAGIPAFAYVFLYDTMMRAPFVDESRVLADSLEDAIFAMNGMIDGPGKARVGESWGNLVVTGYADGLYTVEYVGEGSAAFLLDPSKPMPLAGVYRADRYDPYVGDPIWFHAGVEYMDALLGAGGSAPVEVSDPDYVMRTGTPAGLSWTSDTYRVSSLTTSPDHIVIRGHASGPGDLRIVMPAFGSQYTFWQEGAAVPAEYGVAGGVLSARIPHGIGDIAIHSVPDDVCTGDCLEDLAVRAWDGPIAIVYGGGFHGSVRLSMAAGDPNGVAASLYPPGRTVTVDFDMTDAGRQPIILPHATTHESILDVSVRRSGSTVTADVYGDPAALTLRMPTMTENVAYTVDGAPAAPLAESSRFDTVTATLEHAGGNATYTATADGPSAWRDGLAIPPPVARTGAIWCGMAEPVNAAVIRDAGVNRQDCGVTKFDGGGNAWC